MKLPRQNALSFTPFMQEWREYSFSYFKSDSWAALSIALMAIPQSIAYSLLAGLPPIAGILSSIFGSMFAAALGSSRHLIVGPSTGIAILIQTSIADILTGYPADMPPAVREALILSILTQIVFIVGLLQVAAAFSNVSKLLQFVSRPVALGYFAGIFVSIIVTQSFYFTGIKSAASDATFQKIGYLFTHVLELDTAVFFVGAASFVSLIFLRRTLKNWPHALCTLIIGALVADLIHYSLTETVPRVGDANIQISFEATYPFIDFSLLNKIFPAAAAISFLGILEVFTISRSFAARAGVSTQINQDVVGLGIANTILSFFYGALCASGSTTRTSLNYQLAAKTRLAAILSGIFIAIIVYFCWPLVQRIPLAALAALLIATAPALMNWKEVKLCFKATREDAFVFVITFLSCIIFSLDTAFFIGILLSIGSFLLKSSTPHLVEYAFNSKGRLMIVAPSDEVHRKVRIIGIAGELYFASAEVFQLALQAITEDRKTAAIVLRLNNVYHMDASMCLAIQHLFETLQSSNRHLVISGLTEGVWHVFHRAGLVKQIGLDNLYFTNESNPQFSTWKACLRAQELLHQAKK